jgi:phospholipid/cholesterol/gamma-HCH transport system substrate-binding protein
MRRTAAAALATALALGACSVETAGAPGGDVTVYATFDDVADLTPGHNVQASNVVVGSVADIELDGYEARVALTIVDDFSVPVGTAAVVRRTSLLGEYYVDLVLPAGFDPDAGPFLADEAAIDDTATQPDVEQLAEQAAIVVGALTADDLGASVAAAAEGLGGRGEALNQLVDDAATVAAALADQQAAIAATVDSMGELGATLAPETSTLTALLDELADASSAVAASRDRMVAAAEALVGLATATNDTVLEPHAERLATLLEQLEPLLGTLADRSAVLADLIVDLDRFTTLFPQAIHQGTVLLLTWAYLDVPALQGAASAPVDPLDALAELVGGTG